MVAMTADQNFSRPGAIDLSGLTAAQPANQPAGTVGGSYVIEVSEATFEQVAQQSMRYPVLLAFTSSRDAGSAPAIADLGELVNAAQGRMLLGVVDVDAQPRIAQALGVQAVPTVVALIGGQIAPLYQGTRDKAEVQAVLDQVLQVAAANGLTGRAAPQSQAAAGVADDAEPASDPRFAAADAALEAGDFDAAVAEFDKLLRANPRDAEAQAGRAQAALLARTTELDDATVDRADQNPDDIEAQFAASDLELISGNPEAAFQRLIDLVARTAGPEREQVRVRLVELFETMDAADPVVKRARRALSMVLF